MNKTNEPTRTPITVCAKCQKEFVLGVSGTVEGCDTCNHAARDLEGHVIDDCCCFELAGDNDKCKVHVS